MKSLNLKKVLGMVAVVVVVLVAGILFRGGSELTEEEIGTPPGVVIDSGYNATLSGSPYYFVTRADERMYDDSLDTCTTKGSNSDRLENQNGWYRLVAWEDDLSVKEIVFSQVELKEDDPAVIFYYNSEDQTFEAQPNKILRNADGSRLPELDLDKKLDKGEVVVVTSNRSAEFCADYDEASPHTNVHEGWNLIAKPDFERVDFRSIWEVALAKGGNSGVLPDKYFPTTNNNFDANALTDNDLYWVYVGSGGVIDPGGEPEDDQEIVLMHDGKVISNGEKFEISEKDGVFQYKLGLKENAAEKIELEFELLENGQVVANIDVTEEVTSRAVGGNVTVKGITFDKGEKDPADLVLTAIDDSKTGDDTAELRVKDKAGKLDTKTFKLDLIDDESTTEKSVNVLVVTESTTETGSQTPVDGATVAIKGTITSGQTGADGKVELKTVADSVELEVSATGFESKTVSVDDYSNEVVVVLEKTSTNPTEGATLEVKSSPIDKDQYVAVGAVDGSMIKSFDLNKINIKKLPVQGAAQVVNGADLEGVLEGGDATNGHPVLRIKLVAGDWLEGTEYEVSFSRNAVDYVGNTFNPASLDKFKVNNATPVEGSNLEVQSSPIDKNEFLVVQAVDGSKIKSFDLEKIQIDKLPVQGAVERVKGADLEGVLEGGNDADGYSELKIKLVAGDWNAGQKYRVSFVRNAVDYAGNTFNPASIDEFETNADATSTQNTVNVIVRDKDTKDLLPGANVRVVGTANSFQTDVFGEVSFTIDSDTVELEASYLGYDNKTVTVNDFSTDTIIELETSNVSATDKNVKIAVRDQDDTNVFISGAEVRIKGEAAVLAVSDGNGRADIQVDNANSVVVEVSKAGYVTKERTISNFDALNYVELKKIVNGPALSLLTPVIYPNERVYLAKDSGTDVANFCSGAVANQSCLMKNLDTNQEWVLNATNGFAVVEQTDRVQFYLVGGSEFPLGEYSLEILGHKYTDGKFVPDFNEKFEVVENKLACVKMEYEGPLSIYNGKLLYLDNKIVLGEFDLSDCDYEFIRKDFFFVKANNMTQPMSGLVGFDSTRNIVNQVTTVTGNIALFENALTQFDDSSVEVNVRLEHEGSNPQQVEFTVPLLRVSSDALSALAESNSTASSSGTSSATTNVSGVLQPIYLNPLLQQNLLEVIEAPYQGFNYNFNSNLNIGN